MGFLPGDPSTAVTEMLAAFVQSHPGVQVLDGFPDVKVVVRAQLDKTKVALISGASVGHRRTRLISRRTEERFFASRRGSLSVFSSPPPSLPRRVVVVVCLSVCLHALR